jgi:hypothetical protein
LPTESTWNPGDDCLGSGIDAVLGGSSSDPRITWALDRASGMRIELIWPTGYSARFSPDLELLDETGRVVGRAGDPVLVVVRSRQAT